MREALTPAGRGKNKMKAEVGGVLAINPMAKEAGLNMSLTGP